MKKKRKTQIIKTSGLIICFLCLLVVSLMITINKRDNQMNSGDLIVDTESEKNPDSMIELKAHSRVESGVTKIVITATPKGSVSGLGTGYNNELKWELKWSSEKEEDVSEYVKLEVFTNTVVQLTYLKQFDTQIILTATSVENADIHASCTVDCYKRSNFDEYKIKFNDTDYEVAFSNSEIDLKNIMTTEEMAAGRPIELIIESGSKVGTIDTITDIYGCYTISSELSEALFAKGYENFAEITFDSFCQYDVLTAIEVLCNNEFELYDREDGRLINQELHEILAETESWFTLYLTTEDLYDDEAVNSNCYELNVLVEYTPVFGEITSVELTKDSIIF